VSTSADDDDVAVLLQSIVGDLMGRPGTNDSARVEHHPLIVTSTRHPLFTRWCVEFPLSLGNVGQITVSESPGGTTSSWWTVVDGVLPSAAELMHSAVIPVTVSSVNDAPVLHLPSPTISWSVDEDEVVVVGGVSVSDVDGDAVEVLIEVDGGKVSVVSTGEWHDRIMLSGSLFDVNAALRHFKYTPDPDVGSHVSNISVTVGDGELVDDGVIRAVRVFGVNDSPVILVPGATINAPPGCEAASDRTGQGYLSGLHSELVRCGATIDVDDVVVMEDSIVDVPIRVEDADVSETVGGAMRVLITADHGDVRIGKSRVAVLEDAWGRLMLAGSLTVMNEALLTLRYAPYGHDHGRDVITIVASDQGFTGYGGEQVSNQTIPVRIEPVNDAPTVICPASHGMSVLEDVALGLPVSVVDIDGGAEYVVVNVTTMHGTLMIGDATLDRLEFLGGSDPSYGHAAASSLPLTGRFYDPWVAFSGQANDVSAALQGLRYTSHLNWNSEYANSLDVVRVTVTDADGLSDDCAMYVEVVGVNDAPVVIMPGSVLSTTLLTRDGVDGVIVRTSQLETLEDVALDIMGVAVRDVDITDTLGTLEVRVGALHGFVEVSPSSSRVECSGGCDGDLVGQDARYNAEHEAKYHHALLFGHASEVNATLASGIRYIPSQDWSGVDEVEIFVRDSGGLSDVASIVVRVLPVNDVPSVGVPSATLQPLVIQEEEEVRIVGAPPGLLRPAIPREELNSGYELWWSEGVLPVSDHEVNPYLGENASMVSEEGWRHRLVRDIFPGSPSSKPGWFTEFRGLLYFSADDGIHGDELWRTDGSETGTVLVKDNMPGSVGSGPEFLTRVSTSGSSSGTNGDDAVLYFAADGVDTTWMLLNRDACGGFKRSSSMPDVVGYAVSESTTWEPGRVYDCPLGHHWASTEEGLSLFGVGVSDGLPAYFGACGWDGFVWDGGDRRMFRFSDSHVTGSAKPVGDDDNERIIVDNHDVVRFAGIVCVRSGGGSVSSGLSSGGVPPRSGDKGAGNELWVSDGSVRGTRRVSDSFPGMGSSNPMYLLPWRGGVLYSANDGVHGRELWWSDGQWDGTRMVEDSWDGHESGDPRELTPLGDPSSSTLVLYSGSDASRGRELWVTDGLSKHGTSVVFDINPGPSDSNPVYLTSWDEVGGGGSSGNTVFFAANDGVHGEELWSSDGTSGGTRLVVDAFPGPRSSKPSYLVMHGGCLYFSADDGVHGAELWKLSSVGGTPSMLADVLHGSSSSSPRLLTSFVPRVDAYGRRPQASPASGHLVFVANDGVGGSELWVSDGTDGVVCPSPGVGGGMEVCRRTGTTRAFEHTHKDIRVDPSMGSRWRTRLAVHDGSIVYSATHAPPRHHPHGDVGVLIDGQQQHYRVSSFSVADVDSDTVNVTLWCDKGLLSFTGHTNKREDGGQSSDHHRLPTGMSMHPGGMGVAAETIWIHGTVGDVNLYLAQVNYAGKTDEQGGDVVKIVAVDADGGSSGVGELRVSIEGVNDAAVVTNVGSPSPDGSMWIGASIHDPDGVGKLLRVVVQTSGGDDVGRISLHSLTGLTLLENSSGEDQATRIVFLATEDDANRALHVLTIRDCVAGADAGCDVEIEVEDEV